MALRPAMSASGGDQGVVYAEHAAAQILEPMPRRVEPGEHRHQFAIVVGELIGRRCLLLGDEGL